MFAGNYENYADYVNKHKAFFPEIYEPDYEEEEEENEEETTAEFMQRVYNEDLRGKTNE